MHTKIALWLRIIQFLIALMVFTAGALMPSNYITASTSDHTLHFIGNALLFLSASVAAFGRMKLGMLILLLIPYSLLIELSQWLTPSRQVDSKDMIANMLGLTCGFLMAHAVERGWSRLRRKCSR
jgi:VanZ family protein